MSDLERFVRKSPSRTSAGTVSIVRDGKVLERQRVPAGFDLLQYATFVYDNDRYKFSVRETHDHAMMTVDIRDGKQQVVSIVLCYDGPVDGTRA